MATRPCLGPGDRPCPTRALARGGPRCPDCAIAFDAPARAVYDDPRWRRLRTRRIRTWISEHGPWCPGDEHHDAHVSFDLTLDHVIEFTIRPDLAFEESNTRVLCRDFNSARARRDR